MRGDFVMSKRGKVLRDPYAGPGLLMVEGQQYSFGLEGVWKSEVPAKPGLVVDVDFDQDRNITGITAVPESQLAKEQATLALEAAKARGGKLFGQLVAKVGMPRLVAAGVLFISWIWLTAVSIQLPFGKMEFTFWQVLGFLNSDNVVEMMERNGHPSAGLYGFLALLCIVAPFLHYVWKDKRAVLGGLLPLVFMIIVGVMARSSMANAMGGAGSPYGEMQKQVQDEMMKAISFGMGAYLSVLASLYFAGIAAKNYLAAKASEIDVMPKSHKAAA
jgi:hypothetical protein